MDRSAVSGIVKGIRLLAQGIESTTYTSEETLKRTLLDIKALTEMALDTVDGVDVH